MQFHRGRLLDHVEIHSNDMAASERFYRAVLAAVNPAIEIEKGDEGFFFDEVYVSPVKVGNTTKVHFAFQAFDKETVHRFYEAGLAAGGRDNGAPGFRKYHSNYYAAFLFDPDGHNVEAVFHGPSERSTESVVWTADMGEGE
jgi:predicted lactoylglutathione lyase